MTEKFRYNIWLIKIKLIDKDWLSINDTVRVNNINTLI